MSEKNQLLKEMLFSIINSQDLTINLEKLAEQLNISDPKTVIYWLDTTRPDAPSQAQVFAIQELLIKNKINHEQEEHQSDTLFTIEEIDTQVDLMLAGIESEQMPLSWHFSAGRTIKRLIEDLKNLTL